MLSDLSTTSSMLGKAASRRVEPHESAPPSPDPTPPVASPGVSSPPVPSASLPPVLLLAPLPSPPTGSSVEPCSLPPQAEARASDSASKLHPCWISSFMFLLLLHGVAANAGGARHRVAAVAGAVADLAVLGAAGHGAGAAFGAGRATLTARRAAHAAGVTAALADGRAR